MPGQIQPGDQGRQIDKWTTHHPAKVVVVVVVMIPKQNIAANNTSTSARRQIDRNFRFRYCVSAQSGDSEELSVTIPKPVMTRQIEQIPHMTEANAG